MFYLSSMFDNERLCKVMHMLQGMQMRLTTTYKKGSRYEIYSYPMRVPICVTINQNEESACVTDYSLTEFLIWVRLFCNGVYVWQHSLNVYSGLWREYQYVIDYKIGIWYVMLMFIVRGLIYRYDGITGMLGHFKVTPRYCARGSYQGASPPWSRSSCCSRLWCSSDNGFS